MTELPAMQLARDVPVLPPGRSLTRGGYTLAWYTLGPEDGPALILCHGLAASGLQFVTDAHVFAETGYRVIVPDLRGHGRSRSPKVRNDEDFTLEHLATDILALLDAEGIARAHWVGNSLGGIVGLKLAALEPGRLARFVTFGTSYALDAPAWIVTLIRLGYIVPGKRILAPIGGWTTCRRRDARAIIRTMLANVDPDAVVRTVRHLVRYDLRPAARNRVGRKLMIQGVHDGWTNRALAPILDEFEARTDFDHVRLVNAGHCANLDQPDMIRGLIHEFLNADL